MYKKAKRRIGFLQEEVEKLHIVLTLFDVLQERKVHILNIGKIELVSIFPGVAAYVLQSPSRHVTTSI